MRSSACLVLIVLGAFACGTRMARGPLDPIPRAPAQPGRPYMQVREWGRTLPVYVVWWSFDERAPPSHPAVAIDLRNDDQRPVVVDLARARYIWEFEGDRPEVRTAPVTAAGHGGIPGRIDRSAGGVKPLVLSPGERRTVWLAFSRPEGEAAESSAPRRIWSKLALPIAGATEVIVTLFETAPSPSWKPVARPSTGITGALGAADGLEGGLWTFGEVSVYDARGPIRIAVSGRTGAIYEPGMHGARKRQSTLGLELHLRPHSWVLGAFLAGQRAFIDTGSADRNPFGWSAGLVLAFESGPAPLGLVRFGYLRSYLGIPRSLLAAVEVPLFRH